MDELLSRQMPHSAEAEQAVLGSILIDPRCLSDVVSVLKPADFYNDINREIYEIICSMYAHSKPVDAVVLLEEMRLSGVIKPNSRSYLLELMNITPTAANVLNYATIVRDKTLLRSIAEAASDISARITEGNDSGADMLEYAERKIYALRQGRNNSGLEHISSVLSGVFAKLGELANSDGSIPGLPTGLVQLDNLIMGLNKSDFILLASRPGVGKTALALNVSVHVAKMTGKSVAIFNLEMSKEQLAMRMLSGESYVDSRRLMTGRLTQEDWSKIAAAAASISKTGIYINDNSMMTVLEMNAQCRRIENLGLVVIDYLQLMQSASGANSENRLQAVSEMSRMLKIMAKELNVPVLCLCQLSRANVQRQDKRPVLSDLRESGSLEQDADIVLGLYREDAIRHDAEEHNTADLLILKNRHGDLGKVSLQWIPEYTTYSALDTVHEDE